MDYDTSLTLGHGDENVRRKVAVFVASGGRGLTELVFCLCMAKQRERVNWVGVLFVYGQVEGEG